MAVPMDFGNPASLFSGLFIGLIGLGLFMYGKKAQRLPHAMTGLALCVFPYFVTSVALSWLITAVCLGGLYFVSREG